MFPSGFITSDDYMDVDVAYLLGMLFGRGQLIEQGDVRRLIVTLSIRRTMPKLPPGVQPLAIDLELENERSLNEVRRRVNELLDANVDISPAGAGKTALVAVFVKRTIAWRDLKTLCTAGTDHTNFRLPDQFFQFPQDIREEFLRGFGDVAVTPSWADNERNTWARVAFPVPHANIPFARQLDKLFHSVNVKSQLLEGSQKTNRGNREHRIRMRAEEYLRVGFRFRHKNELLKVLADYNIKKSS